MLKENAQKLSSELQRHPERFTFLPAPGYAEFRKSMSVVAPLSNLKNTDVTDSQSTLYLVLLVCKVCK